jgi:hypothetical protein
MFIFVDGGSRLDHCMIHARVRMKWFFNNELYGECGDRIIYYNVVFKILIKIKDDQCSYHGQILPE